MLNKFCRCPLCAGYATRIHRRFLDRIVNLFVPLNRYKCHNFHCQWQGNIRKQSFKKDSIQHNNTNA